MSRPPDTYTGKEISWATDNMGDALGPGFVILVNELAEIRRILELLLAVLQKHAEAT